ncbi:MAG: hypothetical protein N2662_09365 [Bacteroidales bacterium]|nr:hypothetical protein [Bacteroidales bacterium]
MKMHKFLIFRVNGKKMGIRADQVVNILKNVSLAKENLKNKFLFSTEIWGIEIPVVALHYLIDEGNKYLKYSNLLLVETKHEEDNAIIGITIDEITELTMLDDLLSYPFLQKCSPSKVMFKEMILNHKGEPLIILNTYQLLQYCEGTHNLFNVYLSN